MKTLSVIHLRGTQEEMGYQHGRLVLEATDGTDIREKALACYPFIASRLLADANVHGFFPKLAHGVAKRLLNRAAAKLEQVRPAEYLERSRAFLKGLELPPHLARQFMLMDVFQNAIGLASRFKIGPLARQAARVAMPACSSLAVWGEGAEGGRLLHGRNLDFPANDVWDAHPTVVFCEPDEGLKYGYIGTMGVDLPGVTAFNEAGLAISAHTRFHRDISFSGAAVVDFCHDIIRRADTLEAAVAISRERKIASTWGVMVSSSRERRAVVLEATARGVEVVSPIQGRDYQLCSNANRHPNMIGDQVAPMPSFIAHSDTREARLDEMMAESRTHGPLNTGDLQRIMGDHGLAGQPGEERAGGAVVAQAVAVKTVVFDAENERMSVSTGDAPTGWGPYLNVAWNWDQEVGLQSLTCEPPKPDEHPEHWLRQGARYRQGATGEAFQHWVRATASDLVNHDSYETAEHIEKAIERDPEEPTYRLIGGVLRMRHQDFQGALAHLEAGLQREHEPFRRGQFLLWASRAATLLNRMESAEAYREELLGLKAPHIDEFHQMALEERTKPYTRRQAKKLVYNLMLVDAL